MDQVQQKFEKQVSFTDDEGLSVAGDFTQIRAECDLGDTLPKIRPGKIGLDKQSIAKIRDTGTSSSTINVPCASVTAMKGCSSVSFAKLGGYITTVCESGDTWLERFHNAVINSDGITMILLKIDAPLDDHSVGSLIEIMDLLHGKDHIVILALTSSVNLECEEAGVTTYKATSFKSVWDNAIEARGKEFQANIKFCGHHDITHYLASQIGTYVAPRKLDKYVVAIRLHSDKPVDCAPTIRTNKLHIWDERWDKRTQTITLNTNKPEIDVGLFAFQNKISSVDVIFNDTQSKTFNATQVPDSEVFQDTLTLVEELDQPVIDPFDLCKQTCELYSKLADEDLSSLEQLALFVVKNCGKRCMEMIQEDKLFKVPHQDGLGAASTPPRLPQLCRAVSSVDDSRKRHRDRGGYGGRALPMSEGRY